MVEIRKDNEVLKVSKATYNDMFKIMGYVLVEETKTAPKAKIIEEEEEELVVIPKTEEEVVEEKPKTKTKSKK